MGDEIEPTDELARAVKFVGKDTIEGPVFLYSGPKVFGGKDIHGNNFTPNTDLCLDWFGKSGRPLLYEHGLDSAHAAKKVGVQADIEYRAEGVWQQSQLDMNAKYRKAIDGLIEREVLGYSGGAMEHLARANRSSGDITRFPWVETSLTPIPANPDNLGVHYVKSASDVLDYLEDIPSPVKAALAALDEWAETRDDESLPDGLKFADLLDRLSVDGRPWVQARMDWYAKSGRVLSTSTRERLTRHPASLRELADDLDALLAEADSDKAAKSAGFADLSIETLRLDTRLAELGLLPSGVNQ